MINTEICEGDFRTCIPIRSTRLWRRHTWLLSATAFFGMAQLASAASLAPLGKGIMGVNDAVDTDAGTPYFHAGLGKAINDGDVSTRVDNYFGDPPTDGGKGVSFVGIVWPGARYESIRTLTLDLA